MVPGAGDFPWSVAIGDLDGDGALDPALTNPFLDNVSVFINTPAVVDSDGDGIPDDVDNCPNEDATGFDPDGDGCIDSFGGLNDDLDALVDSGAIDEQLQNSLLSKVDNANKSATKENICAAVNQLEALKNQIEAQRGNKISDEAADLLIDYTDNLITQLLSELPPGESC